MEVSRDTALFSSRDGHLWAGGSGLVCLPGGSHTSLCTSTGKELGSPILRESEDNETDPISLFALAARNHTAKSQTPVDVATQDLSVCKFLFHFSARCSVPAITSVCSNLGDFGGLHFTQVCCISTTG